MSDWVTPLERKAQPGNILDRLQKIEFDISSLHNKIVSARSLDEISDDLGSVTADRLTLTEKTHFDFRLEVGGTDAIDSTIAAIHLGPSGAGLCGYFVAGIDDGAALVNGDSVGHYLFSGYDGTSFKQAARLFAVATDTWSHAAHAVDVRLGIGPPGTGEEQTLQTWNASSILMHEDLRCANGVYIGSLAVDPADDSLTVDGNIGFGGVNAGTVGRLYVTGNTAVLSSGYFLNTMASDASSGGYLVLAENDGAAMGSGHRMASFIAAGYDGTAIRNSAGMFAYASDTWVAGTSYPTELRFQTTALTSRTTQMYIRASGNIEIVNNYLKVGGCELSFPAAANIGFLGGGASCSLTLPDVATVITGGGTLALATYTLTVPATGTAALGTGAANRVAYWSGTNTLTGLVDAEGYLHSDGAGTLSWEAGAPGGNHDILSATHDDSAAAAVARGSMIVGNSTPAWSRLTVGGAGAVLRTDGTDIAWSTYLITGTAGGTTALAVTNTKTLTLTATDSYNLTIPATGTAALLATAQTFTAAQKINANSTTAFFVEQDGVKDNVLVVDTTNAWVGINTAARYVTEDFLVTRSGTGTSMFSQSFSGAAGTAANHNFGFRSARGTLASPSAVQSGDYLGWFNFRGYGATAFAATARAGIAGLAAENWTDAAHGTYESFLTTPIGSTTLAEGMRLDDAGNLSVKRGLYVGAIGGAVADDQAYIEGNCSALTFTDRTPWFAGDALAAVAGIRGQGGMVDHQSLPEFARKTITRTIKRVPLYDEAGKILDPGEDTREVMEGRDLGAMISLLTVATQQLAGRIANLEKPLEKPMEVIRK